MRCLYITLIICVGYRKNHSSSIGRWGDGDSLTPDLPNFQLNQKSRVCVCVGGGGGEFYLHIWQHRASSNHDLFCFAYDYVGKTEITERLVRESPVSSSSNSL